MLHFNKLRNRMFFGYLSVRVQGLVMMMLSRVRVRVRG